jgi:hypothetical protein
MCLFLRLSGGKRKKKRKKKANLLLFEEAAKHANDAERIIIVFPSCCSTGRTGAI